MSGRGEPRGGAGGLLGWWGVAGKKNKKGGGGDTEGHPSRGTRERPEGQLWSR